MRRTQRALATGVVVTICVGLGARVDAATQEVIVRDFRFDPVELTIDAGDTVRWRQVGDAPHTVTADNGSFDSHPTCQPLCMQSGDTFERPFPTPGTFAYYCKIHGAPGGQGMSGRIIVRAPATTTTSTAPATSASTGTSATTTASSASGTNASAPASGAASTGSGNATVAGSRATAPASPEAAGATAPGRTDRAGGQQPAATNLTPGASSLPASGGSGTPVGLALTLIGLATAANVMSTRRAGSAAGE